MIEERLRMCDKFCHLRTRMEISSTCSPLASIDMRNGGQLRKAIDATLSDRNASELIFSGGIVSHLESGDAIYAFCYG